jgi:hypothetical protein
MERSAIDTVSCDTENQGSRYESKSWRPTWLPTYTALSIMTDHRAKFDFTIHFTNGGSLSAEGFRLDIPGSDITDDQLAAYLISDMRLLMAGRVDISNKEIIKEPHKRRAIDTSSLPNKTVDLSAGDMSLEELLELAEWNSLRVIAKSGESYVVSRLVV